MPNDSKIIEKKFTNKTIAYITEEIDGWGYDLSCVQRMLANASQSQEPVEIQISSDGGDVFMGIAIANLISNYPYKTSTVCIGLAASIASVILMAGDTVSMMKNTVIMIHNTSAYVCGGAADVQKTAETMLKMDKVIAGIYANQIIKAGKAGKRTTDEVIADVQKMMDAETYLTCQEALDLGFIDKCYDEKLTPNDILTEAETIMPEDVAMSVTDSMVNKYTNKKLKIPANIVNHFKNQQLMSDKKATPEKGLLQKFFDLFKSAEGQKLLNEANADVANNTTDTTTTPIVATTTTTPAVTTTPVVPVAKTDVELAQELLAQKGFKIEAPAPTTEQAKLTELENKNKELQAKLDNKVLPSGNGTTPITNEVEPKKGGKAKLSDFLNTAEHQEAIKEWGKAVKTHRPA